MPPLLPRGRPVRHALAAKGSVTHLGRRRKARSPASRRLVSSHARACRGSHLGVSARDGARAHAQVVLAVGHSCFPVGPARETTEAHAVGKSEDTLRTRDEQAPVDAVRVPEPDKWTEQLC